MQVQMIKDQKAGRGKNYKARGSDLDHLFGKLMDISKALNDRVSNYCMYDQADEVSKCKYRRTSVVHYIQAPYPKTFCVNIAWYDNSAPYMDTLRFCASIPQKFELSDLFETKSNEKCNSSYILQSVVCFLGAHYMTYIKKKGD